MKEFRDIDGEPVVRAMIAAIQQNAAHLSEVDGAIGDGDHGINMNKGFALCAQRLDEKPQGFADSLNTLARVLMAEIGGSMGPLYGSLFRAMAKAAADASTIDKAVFGRMLTAGVAAVGEVGGAKPGDKTLMDVLVPALEAYNNALLEKEDFETALSRMAAAAEQGKDSTRELVAKVGRSARLGERSRGALDAGAVSCSLLLRSMAEGMVSLLP